MAQNKEDIKSTVFNNNTTPDSAQNSFDMKKCEETLPNIDNPSNSSEEGSDDEYSDAKDVCDSEINELDDEFLLEMHKDFTDEQLEKTKEDAIVLKGEGNNLFKESKYLDAMKMYTNALNTCPLKFQQDRAILFANRAAAKINLDKKEEAVLDCNKAIDLDPNYLKAILRRAQLHRTLDNLDRSLEDYKKVMELDKNNTEARQACATMPAEIAERNEKLKQEMFGKLKELGNLCLGPFGLSTDNFKLVQDPQSGGYSVSFQNNNN